MVNAREGTHRFRGGCIVHPNIPVDVSIADREAPVRILMLELVYIKTAKCTKKQKILTLLRGGASCIPISPSLSCWLVGYLQFGV